MPLAESHFLRYFGRILLSTKVWGWWIKRKPKVIIPRRSCRVSEWCEGVKRKLKNAEGENKSRQCVKNSYEWLMKKLKSVFCLWRNSTIRVYAFSLLRSLDHTHPVGLLWTSDRLVAESATYTTHNKQKRRISMPSAGFELAIPAVNRPQKYAWDGTATGIGIQADDVCKCLPHFYSDYFLRALCVRKCMYE